MRLKIASLHHILFGAALSLFTIASPSYAEHPQTLTIAAANSLKDVLRTVLPLFEKEQGNVEVRLVWGPSQTLREQIAQGAPIDVFLPSSLEEERSDPTGHEAGVC